MKKTNQTEKQIAALLEKAGRTSDKNTPTTVIIADRGGETIPEAYGFFIREATSPQGCDDRNEPGAWNYSDEEEPNQIHIWMMDDDPDTRKEARMTDQDPQVLQDELTRTREILTQTQTERDQARNELKATIDAHEEKPITLNGRETQILDALVEAGAIKQARKLFYERDVIQAKLRTHTELDGSERETLLGLVRDANENEIPWTNDEIPL